MAAGETGASWRRDAVAGLGTALTLSYVLLAVPTFLARAGMDFAGAYAACGIAMVLGTALMGFLRLPIAAAPSVPLVVWLVMLPVISHGLDWRALLAVGAAASAVLLFGLFTLGRLHRTRFGARRFRRELVHSVVPPCIERGLAGGVGLMLIFTALSEGRLLMPAPAGLLQIGDLHDPVAAFGLVGVLLVLALMAARVRLAVFYAMLIVAVLSFVEGFWIVPSAPFFEPEGLDKTAFQLFCVPSMDGILWGEAAATGFVLLLYLALDGWGSLIVLAQMRAPHGETSPSDAAALHGRKTLAVFGALGIVASALGTVPVVAAPESAVGQSLGGSRRMSWFTALFLTGLLFLAPTARELASFPALFVPALVGAGILLLQRVQRVFSGDFAERAAAGAIFLLAPLTKSLALSIGTAFFLFVFLKCMAGRMAEVRLPARVLAVCFLLYWYFGYWPTF
ncbi:hypothetical protein [Mitsuokella sp. oral taxon 131]|uniref:hypothetical protein n=1 Tax=Mitsuokella sp. oral taxon 131 TaxID=1321780 RepID=UPI0005904CC1|nr:hypothetical protein [Mitsuokella sp. oral taxon 131]